MRKAELIALAFEIRALTGISIKLISQDLEQRLSEYHPGMSMLQYGVLRTLEHHPCTLKELSDRMMLAPSTLVPVIDKLENEGLVLRGKDPEDRRRTPLGLTDHARQMLMSASDMHMQDHLSNTLQSMGLEKCRELSGLLQEMVRLLNHDEGLVEHVLSNSSQVASRIDCCHSKGATHHSSR